MARIATNEVAKALQRNRDTVSTILKDEVVGEIQDETNKLREEGLVQKINQNRNETKVGFWPENTGSCI